MNKPAGVECSQKPKHHPSVYSLLPSPLRRRGVQAIGRLDEDTTGVLLFTDDGALIHRLTSPKHHVPKVYEVTCKHAVEGSQIERLLAGVLLHDDNETVRAEACEATGAETLRMTLTEGKYHQVKRMIAAAGNRVEGLERSAFGPVGFEGLAPSAWRWLTARGRSLAVDSGLMSMRVFRSFDHPRHRACLRPHDRQLRRRAPRPPGDARPARLRGSAPRIAGDGDDPSSRIRAITSPRWPASRSSPRPASRRCATSSANSSAAASRRRS